MTDEFISLRDKLRAFAQARDWEQFHAPKNLSMALAVECAELMEHFQWLTPEESGQLLPEKRVEVEEELADVLLYLIRLADRLEVNLPAAAHRKIIRNEQKYPADQVRGSSRKYTEYQRD